MHSLGEKYSWLFESRFGIIAYNYWWGYTSAQIELMIADQPVINYHANKKKTGKAAEAEMEALADEFYAQNKGESMVGKEFSLNDFVSGKI